MRVLSKQVFTVILALSITVMFMGIDSSAASAASKVKMSKCKVVLSATSFTYSGAYKKPSVKVTYRGKKLKRTSSFSVKYKYNKNVGKAVAYIIGKGKYTGTVKRYFRIYPKLSAYSYTMFLGATTKLTVKSSAKCYYYSSDESVAAVTSNGTIRARGGGTAVITVKSNYMKRYCRITVVRPDADKSYAAILKGTTTTLVISNTYPGAEIRYSSADMAVATVSDKGVITGAGSGSTVISAHIIVNGTEAAVLSCKVDVYTLGLSADGLKDGGINEMPYFEPLDMGSRVALSVKNLPPGATVKYTSSNTEAAVISSDGVIDTYSNGPVVITAEVYIGGTRVDTLQCRFNVDGKYLNPGSVSWGVGEHEWVRYDGDDEFAGATDVKWTSTDSSVAKVTPFASNPNGKAVMEGLKEGRVIIKATGKLNGSTVSRSCIVKVTKCDMVRKITANSTSYTTLSNSGSGAFSRGMDASSVLAVKGFARTEGPGIMNHPAGMAYAAKGNDKYLFVCDTWNNRVLVYKNDLPTGSGKAFSDRIPDYVLGQTDFSSSKAGHNMNDMNWPMDVAVDSWNDGGADKLRLYVADTHNNRVLVWDDISALASNGTAADHYIGWTSDDHSDKANHLNWPWAVSTDADKLIITDTKNSKTLIWNSLQGSWQDNVYPDIQLQYGKGSTPRTIITDGTQLIIGDENIIENGVGSGMRIYNTFPTSSSATYYAFDKNGGDLNYGSGCFVNAGGSKWLVISSACRFYIWKDGKIDSAADAPDMAIGDGGRDNDSTYFFNMGLVNEIINAGGTIYASMSNGNKVVGFNSQTVSDFSAVTKNTYPDFWFGAAEKFGIEGTEIASDVLIHNPLLATDGKSLVAANDLDQMMYVWKTQPAESGVLPDYSYVFKYAASDVDITPDGKLIVANRTHHVLLIWNSIPEAGEQPDRVLAYRIGSHIIAGTGNDAISVAVDSRYFYLSSGGETLVYEGIPDKESEPKYILPFSGVLSSNGKYLGVASKSDSDDSYNKAYIYDIQKLFSGDADAAVVDGIRSNIIASDNTSSPEGYTNPNVNHISKVLISDDGKVFMADMGNDRVLVWNSVSEVGNAQPIMLGQGPSYYDTSEFTGEVSNHDVIDSNNKDTLAMPDSLAYDGTNLWVGEFKFSGRIMRFTKQ